MTLIELVKNAKKIKVILVDELRNNTTVGYFPTHQQAQTAMNAVWEPGKSVYIEVANA